LLLTNIKLEKSERITSNSKVGFPGFGVSVCWSCTSGLPSVCSPHCARQCFEAVVEVSAYAF